MYAESHFFDEPRWPDAARKRLGVSLVASSAVVLGLLSVSDLPKATQRLPITELVVQLIRPNPQAAEPAIEPSVPEVAVPTGTVTSGTDTEVAVPSVTVPLEAPAADAVELQDFVRRAVEEYVNRENSEFSINPNMDRRRAAAAEKFAAIPDHTERPVWENVEVDTLGRKVLYAGDCYRVINDPNVGSREVFEIFGQYMVSCPSYNEPPKNLPWVDEVNKRREVLSRYAPPPAE